MSDDKMASPAWPHPTDWVSRLHQELSERQAAYNQIRDVQLRRHKAAMMLARVVHSLRELPPFSDSSALMALKDILIFLEDLDRGRSHPWASAGNVGGSSIATTAEDELKLWVRGVCAVLRDAGFGPTEAYQRISAGLAKTGRTGRKKGPLTWRTIQKWCLAQATRQDPEIQGRVQQWWADCRDHPEFISAVKKSGKSVEHKEIAGAFADRLWTLGHLRDRFIPGNGNEPRG